MPLLTFALICGFSMQDTAPVKDPEVLRPQYHFTAPRGWLNDPNGLVYRDGTYHLFYQHNPFGTEWGNMTWGHATSSDLFHWKHEQNAIEPDGLGTIFSGSAVVDRNNTAGFGKDAIVCLYTAAGGTNPASQGKKFSQCLAWSTDGFTFHKFDRNPVVPHIDGENRDPRVFWYEASKQWVMALYLSGDHFCLLGSKNLKEWSELSRLQLRGASECPDMFELPLDGNKNRRKWVFWAASGAYEVGTFDGKAFTPETDVLTSKWGNTGYASQTYSNAPKDRRIQIQWLNGSDFKGMPWNQQLGCPNVLSLKSTPDGPRLAFWPVEEIHRMRQSKLPVRDGAAKVGTGVMDFEGEWSIPKQGSLELDVNGHLFNFDPASGILRGMGSEMKLDVSSGKLSLRVLADRASIELYAQHGLYLASFFALPGNANSSGISVKKTGDWPGRAIAYDLKL